MSTYMQAGYKPPKPKKPPKKKKTAPKAGRNAAGRPDVRPAQGRPRAEKVKKVKKPLGIRILTALAVCAILATLGALAFAMTAYSHLSDYDGAFYPGVYVGGMHLGGITAEQADTALHAALDEAVSQYTVQITYNEEEIAVFSAQDARMSADISQALTQAWAVGRQGNLLERLRDVMQARETPRTFDIPIQYEESCVQAFAADLALNIDQDAQDAFVVYHPSSAAPFIFTDEQAGAVLDQEDLIARLCANMESFSAEPVAARVEIRQPSVRRAQLENIRVRVQQVHDLPAGLDEGCVQNMEQAIRRINGSAIAPGESFDFNAAVGKRTEENGYVHAPEAAYGADISGVGGGVCHVASVLYQAALLSEMEIVERHPYALLPSGVQAGQDAAVSDQGVNLVFKNATDSPVYIKMRIIRENGTPARIETTFMGAGLERQYALESQCVQTLPVPEPVYVRDREGAFATYEDEMYQLTEGHEGYVYETYRVELGDGEQAARVLISEDTYAAVAPQVYVGVRARDEE